MPKVFAVMLLGGSLVAADPALSPRDSNTTVTVFNRDWKSHGRSEKEYQERLGVVDHRYSRLLEVLLRTLATVSASTAGS